MGQLDNARIEKRDAKRVGAGAAKKWLSTLEQPATSGNAFYVEGVKPGTILEMLQAAANASAFVSFGFNRSGGMNITLMLEGEKEQLRCNSLDEVELTFDRITTMLNAYAVEKGWLRPAG